MATGGAVCIMMMQSGHSVWTSLFVAFLAGMAGRSGDRSVPYGHGNPGDSGRISDPAWPLLDQSSYHGRKGKSGAWRFGKYDQLVSLRWVKGVPFYQNTNFVCGRICTVIIAEFSTGSSEPSWAAPSGRPAINENMSRAQGINTDTSKILGLMISNGIVALSSGLYAQYNGFAGCQCEAVAPSLSDWQPLSLEMFSSEKSAVTLALSCLR